MTLEQLYKQKKDLEQIKEYQCGDHPTRILCVSNITHKDLSMIYSLLSIDPNEFNNSINSNITNITNITNNSNESKTVINLNNPLDSDETNNSNQMNHQHIKSIFIDELDEFNFILISFYDLRQAISTHKMLLKTQKFQVHYALAKDVLDDKEQNQGTVVVFNIEYSVTNDDIKQLFGQCGDIKELRETPLKKHHRFVEFYDLRDAQKAINEFNQFELKGRKLKIEPSRPYGIRQRVLTSCAHVLGMSDSMCGLPPPLEMMKFVVRKIKEIECNNSNGNCSRNNYSYNYSNCPSFNRNRNTIDLNDSNKSHSSFTSHSNNSNKLKNLNTAFYSRSNSSTSFKHSSIQSPSKINPIEKTDVMKSKSPFTISSSNSITLDCLSSLPSVTSQNDFNEFIQTNQFDNYNQEKQFNQIDTFISNDCKKQFEMESTQNQMFYDLYQSSSIDSNSLNNYNELTDLNDLKNEKENEYKPLRPIQSSSTSFSSNSTLSYTPIKHSQSAHLSKQINQIKKKDDNSVLNVPRPTTVGQELSQQYSKETIGTPHLTEKKYNHFGSIEMKGLGFDTIEEIDEMKRVLIIENIPITFTYHELLNRIEQCISCFYDQFIPIKNDDGLTYKCIIRVTNQMVMDNFMMSFNGIFLENDQDDLCFVHEIECQGNYFSHQLNELTM